VVRGGKVQTFSETNRTLAEQQKRGYLTDRAGSNVLSLEEMQGKKVLDLAAGTKGRTVQELRERKIDASGMDIALSEKAAQTGSLRRGDLATAVPFKEKFDIVYEIYGGLSYGMGQQTGAAFQNAISRLKPGGTLYLAPLSTNAQTALLPFVEEVVKRGGKLIRSKFHADEVWRVVMPAK
jgi:SAM-dependent methyltransferase